jgi:hypothetical protein
MIGISWDSARAISRRTRSCSSFNRRGPSLVCCAQSRGSISIFSRHSTVISTSTNSQHGIDLFPGRREQNREVDVTVALKTVPFIVASPVDALNNTRRRTVTATLNRPFSAPR